MKEELLSQYRATLKMLANVIDCCPDDLWTDMSYHSPYWQIVYHSLHFTGLYLSKNETEFIPWSNYRPGIHKLGRLVPGQGSGGIEKGYAKAELKDYLAEIVGSLEYKIDEQSLKEPAGFEWLPMNRFELHLYITRHVQHHIGQLVERLHQNGIKGIDWIGKGPVQ